MPDSDATKSRFETIKVYLQWPILSVFLLGIASGFPLLLTAGTLMTWLTEENIDIKVIGIFALVGLPYTLKFLIAPFIDAIRLPGIKSKLAHRKSWCILFQILLAVSLFGMATIDPRQNLFILALFALLTSTFSAAQDIVIDALRVEMLPKADQGAGAAAVTIGYRIGMLLAGAGAFFMASYFPWSDVYTTSALIMAACIIPTLCIRKLRGVEEIEQNNNTVQNSANQDQSIDETPNAESTNSSVIAWFKRVIVSPLSDFLKRPAAYTILAFIALYKLGDAMAGTLSNTFYLSLGFEKIEIAAITKIFGVIAILFGTFLGGLVVKNHPIYKSLFICGTLMLLSNFVFVGLAVYGYSIPALTLCITVENISGGMGTAAFVAYMSQLCNIRFTATQYALLTSLSSIGRTVLSSSSGLLADTYGWAGFYALTAYFAVPGMLLLYKLYRDKSVNSPENTQTQHELSAES